MLVSAKNGFAFLCTPKCASTSIEAMLKPYCEIAMGQPFKHTNYRTYIKYLEPYLIEKAEADAFETICLVREPVSWLHSWYRFRSRMSAKDPRHPAHRNNTLGVSFHEFIEAYMSPDPPSFAFVGSQFDFVRDQAGGIGVDTIFTYEGIDQFFEYMSHKVGHKLEIEYRNVSPQENYRFGIALKIDRIRHKLRKRLKMRIPPVSPAGNLLPTTLLAELRKFISADFELYESVSDLRSS